MSDASSGNPGASIARRLPCQAADRSGYGIGGAGITGGNRLHPAVDSLEQLVQVINRTAARGGLLHRGSRTPHYAALYRSHAQVAGRVAGGARAAGGVRRVARARRAAAVGLRVGAAQLAQARVDALFRDRPAWARSAILNVAGMGPFSSDRTIAEYAADIWRVKKVPIRLLSRADVRASVLQ